MDEPHLDGGRNALVGGLTIVVAASLFGTLGVLSRTTYDLGMSPLGFVTWRAAIGALTVAAFVLWRVRRRGVALVRWGSLDARARLALTVASIAGAALNLAMFEAFARVPVAIVLLCFYLYPALVAAASAALGWERLDRVRLAALVVAIGGMVAVVAGGPGGIDVSGRTRGLDLLGMGLALSGGAFQTVFVLVSRRGYRAVPTDQAMGLILAGSAASAAVVTVVGGAAGAVLLPFSVPALLGLLLFAGIFAAGLSSSMFLAGIRLIGPVRAGILMLFEPLVGVALAALVLDERIGPIQAAGGVGILAAAILIQRTRPNEAAIRPAAEPDPDPEPGPEPDPEPGPEEALAAKGSVP